MSALETTARAATALIRNFSVIAHVDHGKSTLSDRFLQLTGAVSDRDMREQFLDKMDIERERGITIKAQTVRLKYRGYILNLIDTPGHVDFSYEVSRSLAACEGAVLLVDAAQGIEAQTLANTYLAVDSGLTVVPVINKIDLPAADPDRVAGEIAHVLGVDPDAVLRVSAKTGIGVAAVLDAVVAGVPPPQGDPGGPLRALVFDSYYDTYRGVILNLRIVDGTLTTGERVRLFATGATYDADEIGVFSPGMTPVAGVGPGEVAYLITSMKVLGDAKVGDTLTVVRGGATEALAGYREPLPVVFCGLYPVDGDEYTDLREALEKLRLNDASFTFEPETSRALGFGFRCGFLGLLHMEIVRERLEREFGLVLVATAPNVEYEAIVRGGSEPVVVRSPAELPGGSDLEEVREPWTRVDIISPTEYIGALMDLCQSRRGVMKRMEYLSDVRVELTYELPLAEIVVDFFDQLKSRTKGYASMDYEPLGLRRGELVRVEVLLHGEPVDAFSTIVHRERASAYGRAMVEKLRELIPRQMFDVPIQAAIGGRIIARETVKARRKDVLAKCYGGDITRKRKLLERQKEGKKRMKQIGSVEVPQEAFIEALRIDSDTR